MPGHHGKDSYRVNTIEKVQHHAVWCIHNNYHLFTCVSALIDKLNWDSLELRRIESSQIMFYIQNDLQSSCHPIPPLHPASFHLLYQIFPLVQIIAIT